MNQIRKSNVHPEIDKAIQWLEDATRGSVETDRYGVVALNILKELRGDVQQGERYEYRMYRIAQCSCGCEAEVWKQRQNLFFRSLVEPVFRPVITFDGTFINNAYSADKGMLKAVERHMGYLFTGTLRVDRKRSRFVLTISGDGQVDQLVFEHEDDWREFTLENGSMWDAHLLIEGDDVSVTIYPVTITDTDGRVTDTQRPEPSNITILPAA